MPQFFQSGSLNTTALVVPDLYVVRVPPNVLSLNGVPTDVIGVVGTASWGPANTPVIVGDASSYYSNFGAVQARKFDMGTQVSTAILQGAANFRCVRVTDGTDVAASGMGPAGCITFTAAHTGTLGNGLTVSLSAGSKSGSWRAVVYAPGFVPEVFDNIIGAGNTFWLALASAISIGQPNTLRGPSQILTASAGAGATAAAIGVYNLAGGTDGSAVTSNAMVGSDVARTGMYALENLGVSILVLADVDDSSQWTTIDAWSASKTMYAQQVIPSGTSISAAVAGKAASGFDSYSTKLLTNWLYWNDRANGMIRLVSPQGFVAGRLANLSPEQSSLNKPLYGIVGSEKTGAAGTSQLMAYSTAEMSVLLQAGIDFITNPAPRGNVWAVRGGVNSSSDSTQNGDNYTRLTNYIVSTILAGDGKYVGEVVNGTLLQSIETTQTNFLSNMYNQGILGSVDGSLPFNVRCNKNNNIPTRLEQGYVQCDINVRYQPINTKFIVNFQGGQTVSVTRQSISLSSGPGQSAL